MTVTQEQIDAFKAAWEAKDAQLKKNSLPIAKSGDRTRAGLEAVDALPKKHVFGKIVDSGMPHDHPGTTSMLLDTTGAVAVEKVITMGMSTADMPYLAMCIRGDVNNSEDKFEATVLMDWDFAGVIIAEIMKTAARSGEECYAKLDHAVNREIEEIK